MAREDLSEGLPEAELFVLMLVCWTAVFVLVAYRVYEVTAADVLEVTSLSTLVVQLILGPIGGLLVFVMILLPVYVYKKEKTVDTL